MAESIFFKYIICPDCLIGGYDFCPSCLGAGGYTVPVSESEIENDKFLAKDRLAFITDKIDKIVKSIYTQQSEKKLNEYFDELSASALTKESHDLLLRIIKIRATQRNRDVIKNLKKKLSDVKEIIVDCDGKSFNKIPDELFIIRYFSKNCYNVVPFDNKYFLFTKEFNHVVKLSGNMWASLSFGLFIKLIDYIYSYSLFDYESSQISCNTDFIENCKSDAFKEKLVRINVYGNDFIRNFIIEYNKLDELIISFFSGLELGEIVGFKYIDPFNY